VAGRKNSRSNGANVGYEAELWKMADALRGSMNAAEYKHVVLGLIFLKYISDAFEELHPKLQGEKKQGADQFMGGQGARRQTHCRLHFGQPLLSKAALVERIAFDQVVLKRAGSPDAELGAALRLHPVADGDNDVEVVALYLISFAVLGSMCKFCTY